MRLTQLTTFAAVAGAIAAPLALAAPASAATGAPVAARTGPPASAYGIAASGLVPLAPLPAVASGARPTSRSVVGLPANPLLRARVLTASAAPGRARASVADLRLARIGLSAHLVTASCRNGYGTSHLAKVVLGGRVIGAAASPNSALAVGLDGLGAASVVLNKQVRDSAGRLTVTALELNVPLGRGEVQRISIASATCAAVGAPAPAPTPVRGDLPVTG